jgi:hypothetical protein
LILEFGFWIELERQKEKLDFRFGGNDGLLNTILRIEQPKGSRGKTPPAPLEKGY